VVLPHITRSWISKAHIRDADVEATYFDPLRNVEERHCALDEAKSNSIWVHATCTPAGCVQLGLFHLFEDREPIDLVVSGPNHGRNATAISNLCSGTVGGAMEAALCRRKAIALSFAFKKSEQNNDVVIEATSKAAVKVIESLYSSWDDRVELYNVNLPALLGAPSPTAVYTSVLRNHWTSPSFYTCLDNSSETTELAAAGGFATLSDRLPNTNAQGGTGIAGVDGVGHGKRKFKWAPQKSDVLRSMEEATPGTDGWAVKQGLIRQAAHLPSISSAITLPILVGG
jgi:tubulin---tyrosine ligase